ncbi:hypothetical protein JTE90_020381 [Oedothorax gibbosus]|uniref:Uncharacterized protein n=1 Tax=Oedothorax gibbosus TaxID=931172 RepID=A0AAV6UDH7_9ARAC|nr:hypothetical protein JTE90_020381 [Oedothorax gibbosus]
MRDEVKSRSSGMKNPLLSQNRYASERRREGIPQCHYQHHSQYQLSKLGIRKEEQNVPSSYLSVCGEYFSPSLAKYGVTRERDHRKSKKFD